MRHYCPNIPICLVADGNFEVADLEKEYDLLVLRVSELRSQQMRDLLGGNGRAKLAAMWEGPFEFYVWMDSDAIAWGDFLSQVRTDVDFQVFWSEVSIPPDAREIPPWLPHFYFDPRKLRRFDTNFDWRGHPYFSSGAFACRRGVIPFDKWMEGESWGKTTPGLFADFYEQPLLNYFVHALTQRGEVKSIVSNLQHVWGHQGVDELEQDCADGDWHFPKQIRRPRVAHFCGRKPLLFHRHAYSRPFTIARLEHHRRRYGELGAWLALINEERHVLASKFRRRLRPRLGPSI
jgi:hypothetical protein